jgi:hypothetical protein
MTKVQRERLLWHQEATKHLLRVLTHADEPQRYLDSLLATPHSPQKNTSGYFMVVSEKGGEACLAIGLGNIDGCATGGIAEMWICTELQEAPSTLQAMILGHKEVRISARTLSTNALKPRRSGGEQTVAEMRKMPL